jgi:cell division protein FtsI/penicillin-binding protein 2
MDGYSGEIETITQYPQYNEDNKKKIDMKFLYPLSITQSHEIGSTIKAFLMLSALNENIVNPETQINCWGVKEKKIQGKILTTWKAHGIIPFKTVIKESNNFGVAQIGMILNEKLFSYYNDFGFGTKTGIPISGEHQGILNPIKKWSKRTPISLSFGYEISCTLLQLVSAWSLFTNNGKRVYPKIIASEKSKYSEQIVNQKAIDDSLSILSINKEYKKIYGFEKLNDINIYGKTGTANTLLNNQYNKNINIYTFIGHIEKNNIKKIIGISIHGSNNPSLVASQIALPIFFEISNLINEKINKLYKKNNL